MSGEETKTKYYIFKCRNIACKEIITVKFSSSQNNSFSEILSMVHQYEKLNGNIDSVNVNCPSCRQIYHFKIDEGIKEISK